MEASAIITELDMVGMVPDGEDLTISSSRMVVPEDMTEMPDMGTDMGMDHMAIIQGLGDTQLLIIIITTVTIPPMERWVDAEGIRVRGSRRRRTVIVTVMAADTVNTAHMDTIVATPEEEIAEDTISIFLEIFVSFVFVLTCFVDNLICRFHGSRLTLLLCTALLFAH